MKLKTLQWNIGGEKIRSANSDPMSADSYSENDLDYIIETIIKHSPDIITLQETHRDNSGNQAQHIADKLNFDYINDDYDDSHLESGQRLGQAIISRFPLVDHRFDFFYNPRLTLKRPSGEVWISHNKGFSSCRIKIDNKLMLVGTLHMLPFKKFNLPLENEVTQKILKDAEGLMSQNNPIFLIQGDFNIDENSLKPYFPNILKNGVNEIEIDTATTPKSRKYDHIIYKGMKLSSFMINDSVFTDHYPLISEFTIL